MMIHGYFNHEISNIVIVIKPTHALANLFNIDSDLQLTLNLTPASQSEDDFDGNRQ